ncbi:MAG: tRNA 4-thiouridine(8) synthase ThiI [Syntrophomonadaceae bacterium]|nr:tRNA 4-thiouridine(8) synthase ThiI [Syntrophomonadaceae bacterium]
MRAISLFSGGLDSQLAVALIKKQDIEVLGINFVTPFFGASERTVQAAKDLGIELITMDISDEYIPGVLSNPVYGYGKNLNPCIDCHGFMLKKAGDYMNRVDASFLITGEVVGQRPMSQNKSALNAVDKLSGYRGFIVRPLSGKLLPPTEPEIRGWIAREGLLDINGRGRTRQMELAEQFGIKDYPSPAGGCLLTEQNFARRLRKLLERSETPNHEEMEILKVGRHFVLGADKLLVVGRNQSENRKLEEHTWPNDWLIKVADRPGPLGLLRYSKDFDIELINYSAAIVARYSDAKNLEQARVKVYNPGDENLSFLEVSPLKPEEVPPAV